METKRIRTAHQTLAVLLAFFAFGMAALISRTVFERLPHLEDEVAYVYQARIFARGDLVIETPEPRQAYWQPFIVDYNATGNRFSKYSPGWSLLLSVGVNLGQMWVINAFCGMLTVAVVYRLGREIYNPDVGIIAAALTAFSPMALLQNAALMSHSSALCFLTLFMYAYWRMEKAIRAGRKRPALRWGILAGGVLGLLVINRPLSAVGVALPFILWSAARVFTTLWDWRNGEPDPFNDNRPLFNAIRPLFAIVLVTLLISLTIPVYNHAATDDATTNLYTLVWSYDRIGFGEGYGRNGHTIVKGIRHARFDLSLTAADLFGWQLGKITETLKEHLRNESDYWPVIGLSFFILPFGLLAGFTQRRLRIWAVVGLLWLVIPLAFKMDFIEGLPMVDGVYNGKPIWVWLAVGLSLFLVPPFILLRIRHREKIEQSAWTWLFLGVIVGLIGVHLGYWIGSQRYSTRYYHEALTAFAMIGALPIACLARRFGRWRVYPVLVAALLWSLFMYSLPRIDALRGFNYISQEAIAQIEQHRESTDTPVLVIVSNAPDSYARWRAFGALMAVTSPYLDSDIVVAWDYAPGGQLRAQILARFPDRQVIDMEGADNDSWFVTDGE